MDHCLLIKPDEVTAVKLAEGDTLGQMYELIGCHLVDCLSLAPGIDMWLDDEGMIVADPVPNIPASILAALYGHPGRILFGTVLVTGVTKSGATVNMPERVAKKVLQHLIDALD